MVFSAMICLVKTVYKKHGGQHVKTWDDVVFQMEAHHMGGALISIAVAWIYMDSFRLDATGGFTHTTFYLCLPVVAYAIFFKSIMMCRNTNHIFLMSTYQLLASTLGLIVGLCSQFLLSLLLWKQYLKVPIVDSVIGFSMLWSVATVAITFCGCLVLRYLAARDCGNDATLSLQDLERIHLRMESGYILSTLIGICMAWILMDLVLDAPEQIMPSLAMLGVTLVAFRGILYCFPEEECLSDMIEMKDIDEEQGELTIAII
jgi:hypothetical protein